MKFDFNFKNAIFLSLVVIVLWMIIKDIIASIYFLISSEINKTLGSSVFLFLYLLLTLVIIWWFSKKGNGKELCFSKSDIRLLFPFILLTVSGLFFIIATKELLDFATPPTEKDTVDNFWRIAYILYAILFAPIMEEIFYRGLFQKQLAKKVSPKIAILISSIVFALCHFSIEKIPNTFIQGIIWGSVYHKTNKLTIPILCHSLNNIIVYLLPATYRIHTKNELIFMFTLSLIIAIISIKYLHNFFSHKVP